METKISDLVRNKRKELGVTQEKLAELIGKKRWDIANYENEKAIPPGDVLLRIQALEPGK